MVTASLSPQDLRQHVGRRAISTDVVTPGPANLLRLAFGRPEPELRPGDPLPPGWLGLYFLPKFRQDELRPDGSPLDAGVVPPMPLPRRMFAGERINALSDRKLASWRARHIGFSRAVPTLVHRNSPISFTPRTMQSNNGS